MSESQQQLEAVEITIEKAEEQVKMHEALMRLEKNKDFKYLIIEKLLKDCAIEQIHLRASPQLFAPGPGAEAAKASIEARMGMIGEFANWCRYTHMEGESAKAAIAGHHDTREEILAEQLGE
jgi:hypothetical protein